jgi:hypothetical protein
LASIAYRQLQAHRAAIFFDNIHKITINRNPQYPILLSSRARTLNRAHATAGKGSQRILRVQVNWISGVKTPAKAMILKLGCAPEVNIL